MAIERDRMSRRVEGNEAPTSQVKSPLGGYFGALAIAVVVLILGAVYFSMRGRSQGEHNRDNPAQQTTPNPANQQR